MNSTSAGPARRAKLIRSMESICATPSQNCSASCGVQRSGLTMTTFYSAIESRIQVVRQTFSGNDESEARRLVIRIDIFHRVGQQLVAPVRKSARTPPFDIRVQDA